MRTRPPRRGRPGRAVLSYVSLGVRDPGRAVRFYREALGLAPLKRTRRMTILALGSIRLALLPRAALAREAGIPGSDGCGGMLLSVNVRRREEVAALLGRAAAAGGRIVRPAAGAAWGGETGVFADPDGFPWEVAWNPRLRLAGSGLRPGSPRPARRRR